MVFNSIPNSDDALLNLCKRLSQFGPFKADISNTSLLTENSQIFLPTAELPMEGQGNDSGAVNIREHAKPSRDGMQALMNNLFLLLRQLLPKVRCTNCLASLKQGHLDNPRRRRRRDEKC